MPRSWPWLAVFCAGFMLAAGTFAWQAQYARKETVRGWLVSEQGVVRIVHPVSARVIDVRHRAGDEVREGDIIARVSAEQLLEDGSRPLEAINDLLREELVEVERREDHVRRGAGTAAANLALQLRDIDEELAALDVQAGEQRVRIGRRRDALARLEMAAERGAIAGIELLRRQDELAAIRESHARLLQERGRLGRERRGLVASRDRLDADLELRLSELGSRRSALRERITRNESARLQAIHAPVAGTIATLDLVVGSTIRPQQLLVSIVPKHASLAADVYVPSRAVGLVRRGQTVQLRYDAFPHERFGVARGSVESIAGYVLLPSDVPPTFGLREASYRVRVGLEREYVRDAHGRHALKPGMLLAADIVLESRSLVDWLTSRFSLQL